MAGRLVAAAAVMITAVWAAVLLDRTPGWLPWLRWVVVIAGIAAACALLAGPRLARLARSRRARLALVLVPLGLAMVAGLAGPTAYALDTVGSTHTGSLPSAGPQVAGFGGPGRRRRSGRARGSRGAGGPVRDRHAARRDRHAAWHWDGRDPGGGGRFRRRAWRRHASV